jgi:hypothetical protein
VIVRSDALAWSPMLHGLKSALGWTASSPLKPNQLFLLGDTSEADGSILIPELCAYYVQDMSCPVLMISFRETLDSVLGLYRRLGLDLNMLGARDAFFFIDGSTTIDDLDTVQKQATDFMDKHPSKRCLIIVDEVSILPSLGISLDKIFTFLSFLESINPVLYNLNVCILIFCRMEIWLCMCIGIVIRRVICGDG